MAREININVLYVDDELHNLESFRATFRRDFNIFTAFSAGEAEAILDKVKDIHVLITDQRMPVKLGTELLAETVKKYPKQVRILLTAYADDEEIKDAENRGQIYGYMEKPWDADLLKNYIIQAYGDFYSKIMQEQRESKLNPTLAGIVNLNIDFNSKLSNREKEVMMYIVKELNSSEIAEKLFISKRTVDGHRKNIIAKLNVKNTAGLVKYVIQNGIIKDSANF